MGPRRFGIAAALVVTLAAVLRFDALGSGLPNPRTRPDESPVVQQIGRFDRGEPIEMLVYPHAYVMLEWAWVEVALVLAPLFGVPVEDGLQKTLHRSPESVYLLGRSLSAVAGVLAVLLAALVARREWGDGAGIAAGWLVATCFLHARDSHALKPDALLSLAVLFSLATAARLAERPRARETIVAGVAFGLAMAAKYTGILMAVPIWVAGFLGSPKAGLRRWLPASAIAAGLIGAAVFALTSPRLVFQGPMLEIAHSMASIVLPDLVGGAPEDTVVGKGTAGPEQFAPPPGVEVVDYRGRPWYHGAVFHARFSMWYGMGALATLLAPFALFWGLTRERPLPRLAAITCIVQLVVMGLTPAVAARYLTQVLPVLLLLEAGMIAQGTKRLAPARAALATTLVAGLVGLQPLMASFAHNRIARQPDTRVMAAAWLADELPTSTRLAIAGSVLMPYGQPVPPRGQRVVAHGLDPAVLDAAQAPGARRPRAPALLLERGPGGDGGVAAAAPAARALRARLRRRGARPRRLRGERRLLRSLLRVPARRAPGPRDRDLRPRGRSECGGRPFMKCLVTGSSGLLGQCLVERLEARGDSLLAPRPRAPEAGEPSRLPPGRRLGPARARRGGPGLRGRLPPGRRPAHEGREFKSWSEDEIFDRNLDAVAKVLDLAETQGVRKGGLRLELRRLRHPAPGALRRGPPHRAAR